ncbi:MAG: LpqB family beta-propeller domain-containing protein [Vicinamibacterales bacterium]
MSGRILHAAAVVLCTLLWMALSATAGHAQLRGFTARDLVVLDRLSEHTVSPDGSRIALVVSAVDLDGNRRRSDIWMTGIDGSSPTRLTDHEASDTSPAWTPDGRSILFLSSRSGSSQVWRSTPNPAEPPVQVTSLPLDVGAFRLSPDGQRLAVALEVFPECDTLACTTSRLARGTTPPSTGRIFDRLFVRHWDTWSDGRRSHVFVLPLTGGSPVDVMKGLDADVPSKPFGGTEDFVFTPDSRSIVFSARLAGTTEPWSTNFDLFVVPVDGSHAPRNITADNRATDTGPMFSPDGRVLAYRAMARAGFESDRLRIVVRDWPDGSPRVLADDFDRSADTIVWSPDGTAVFTTADHLGHKALFSIDRGSGRVQTLVEHGHVTGPVVSRDRVVVSIDTLTAPADLYSLPLRGGAATRLTNWNRDRLTGYAMGEAEQISFKGWNDERVFAWIVKPANFNPARTYPLAFLIHGGPQSSFSNTFHYRWNAQTYAGAGYGVVMIDFHGSTGYGQAFTDAIRNDWGGKPLEDLKKGLDAALGHATWLDGSRACALGASYGGYMVNWIAGMWPDRFRCHVSHDGNLDERFAYYATEELWFPEWEHGGPEWERPEGYARHNPIDHIAKWRTPTLVIHGGRDYRIPDTQGLATFTALQRKGIPSRFLHFPDENHWVLKPGNSILWHDTVLEWLNRWTR